MNPLYPVVALRAGHRCEYCRAPEAIFNFPFEVEHIVPSSRNGPDDESNAALACRSCNLFKSDQVRGRDTIKGKVVRLFHPRRHRWDNHFRVERESGTLLASTPTGRATIAALQMNRSIQLEAWRQWMRLGLFP
jgi:hypothetical protein